MNIIKENFSIESNGLLIYFDIYKDIEINHYKGLVQIAHGMIEHKGNYSYIANKLSKIGYIVAINDHRGHGDSIGGDISLGEMGKNGFELAMQDMHNLTLYLKNIYKPKKFILIGHSMGSLLSRRYLQEYEKEIDILILCGTPSPYFGVSFGILFLKICKTFGFNKIGKYLGHRFSFLTFNAKYQHIDSLNDGVPSGRLWTNRDENEILKHIKDSKQNFTFSINSFIGLLCGVKKVFSKYKKEVKNPNMPILFISGEDDACGKFGKGVLKAYKHIISQGYINTKLILYANARHELFVELNKDEVIDDVLFYLQNHSI
ncbi:alpha/beta fold hydrolase [Helicobacter sp. MIT 99-5507]|uniref:alpha/beta fold hydrolase n=1 Tax=Helicobacter sp. MIT 99-5507 TaxID=152489 RepID=UPI000E1EFAF5|nr:alpha/beta hydrolase [Helicobacter sp. MIT 99-5507]RDU58096.1 alpha/beta hydrolase [Helicobacter sp. MIT 99-5507]